MQEMNGATQIHFIRQEKKLILDYFRLHDYQYDDVSTWLVQVEGESTLNLLPEP